MKHYKGRPHVGVTVEAKFYAFYPDGTPICQFRYEGRSRPRATVLIVDESEIEISGNGTVYRVELLRVTPRKRRKFIRHNRRVFDGKAIELVQE